MKDSLQDIKTNFSAWYQDVVYKAELADQAPVRGAMVIRPYGYEIWENIKDILDKKIKETGHENVAFPLLIPQSFLEREAKHVEGFAPEVAVVTYAGGKKLEEPYVIRPTSETIIHYMFAQWIKSWRDLPLKINQWANVIRWELRTRPFLRTSEFFWQEGHTAHETAQEAEEEALLMLNEYVDLYQNYLAIPVVAGLKSESERFAGADKTYTLEGMMQDGKSLQMATSHLISQNFARNFGILFQDRSGQQAYPYLTSWGFTTRSIGALIMVHGDQKGLVIPPLIAPIQLVIIPIYHDERERQKVISMAQNIVQGLKNVIRVKLDDREYETPGAKFYTWELKGVPLRLEIGPRDIANNQVVLVDRLDSTKEKVPFDKVNEVVQAKLDYIQKEMFKRAQARMKSLWYKEGKLEQFKDKLESVGGFYQTGWCGATSCEQQLKNYKATVRCLLDESLFGQCFWCDKESKHDVLIAKSY